MYNRVFGLSECLSPQDSVYSEEPLDCSYHIQGKLYKDRVYWAESDCKRIVAIKATKLDMRSQDMERQCYEEIGRHPHILPLLQALEDKTHKFLVFPIVLRGTVMENVHLLNRVERELIVEQTGTAIAYCHRQGIMHRDLKWDNVLLHYSGGAPHALLCDFNLARPIASVVQTVGANFHQAPEMRKGLQHNEKVDCWAFGLMMLELITLCIRHSDWVFECSSLASGLRKRLERYIEQMDSQEVVRGLLCEDPETRWSMDRVNKM